MQKHRHIPTRTEFVSVVNESDASFNDSLTGWAITGMFKAMWSGGKFLAGKIGDAMRKQSLNTLGRAWASEYEKGMTKALKNVGDTPGPEIVDDTAKPDENPTTETEPSDIPDAPTGDAQGGSEDIAPGHYSKMDQWMDSMHEVIKAMKNLQFNSTGKLKAGVTLGEVNKARRASLELYQEAKNENPDMADSVYVKTMYDAIKDEINYIHQKSYESVITTIGNALNKINEIEDEDSTDDKNDNDTPSTPSDSTETAETTDAAPSEEEKAEAQQVLATAQQTIKAEAPKAKTQKAKDLIRKIWSKAQSLAKKGDVKNLKKLTNALTTKLDSWLLSDFKNLPDFATEAFAACSEGRVRDGAIIAKLNRAKIEDLYESMELYESIFLFRLLNSDMSQIINEKKETAALDLETFPATNEFRNTVIKSINYDAILRIQLEAEANFTRFSGPKSEDIASMKQYWDRVVAAVNAKYNKYVDSAYVKKAINELRVKEEKLGKGVSKASDTISGNTYFMADAFGATETIDGLRNIAPNQNLVLQLDMPPNSGTYFMVSRSMDKDSQKIGGESYYWFVTYAIRRKEEKDNTIHPTKMNSKAIGEVFADQNGHMYVVVSSRSNSTALKHAWFYNSEGQLLCDNPINMDDVSTEDIKKTAAKKTGMANKMSVLAASKTKDGKGIGSTNYFKMAILQKSLVEGDVLGNKIGVNPDTISVNVHGFDIAKENHKQLLEALL